MGTGSRERESLAGKRTRLYLSTNIDILLAPNGHESNSGARFAELLVTLHIWRRDEEGLGLHLKRLCGVHEIPRVGVV